MSTQAPGCFPGNVDRCSFLPLGFYKLVFPRFDLFIFPNTMGFSIFPLIVIINGPNSEQLRLRSLRTSRHSDYTRPQRVLLFFPYAWVFYLSHTRGYHTSFNWVLAAKLFPELEVFHLSSKGFWLSRFSLPVGFGPGGLFPTWGFLNFPQASSVGFSQLSPPCFLGTSASSSTSYQARRLLRFRNGRSSSASRRRRHRRHQHTVHSPSS